MGTTDSASQESAETEVEAGKIEELTSLLRALSTVLDAFNGLASAVEQQAAEGRRCILAVTGLKHHPRQAFFFEVKGYKIQIVDPFTNYTTYIEAPIDSVIRVLKGIWDGREDAFSAEWSRGQAQIRGTRSLHDGMQFNEGFKRVARGIKQYRALTA